MMTANLAVWIVAGLATLGVIVRPFSWPEAIWAVAGAALLVGFGLLSAAAAATGVMKGLDVYLFLVGMMALAEIARLEGLFDWLAAYAVRHARGSGRRLFALVYAVGIVVTVFLSNDATAVVLTPAVYAVARAARADPLPYLFACAFIANAASFVLPISNPANLVVFAERMPPLADWLARFAGPSVMAVAATYVMMRVVFRGSIDRPVDAVEAASPLSIGGRIAGLGILATTVVLLVASARGAELGFPTFVAGIATAGLTLAVTRSSPMALARGMSWSVLPLVAGLFVLVEALSKVGALTVLADFLRQASASAPETTAFGAGIVVAVTTNLVNNLPAGLLAGAAVQMAGVPDVVASAILIGIDLGPNLSVTGSLATILWLAAIRREGEDVTAWQFLKTGMLVTPPALLLALGALVLLAY